MLTNALCVFINIWGIEPAWSFPSTNRTPHPWTLFVNSPHITIALKSNRGRESSQLISVKGFWCVECFNIHTNIATLHTREAHAWRPRIAETKSAMCDAWDASHNQCFINISMENHPLGLEKGIDPGCQRPQITLSFRHSLDAWKLLLVSFSIEARKMSHYVEWTSDLCCWAN